jgi:hypothetical protein
MQTPPPLTVELGAWLYLHVFEVAFVGAGDFLVKARVLNAIISACGAGALILVFRAAAGDRRKVLPTILSICAVVALMGDYSAYFMPDAPYLSLVCLWLLAVTLYARAPRMRLAVIIGFVGGLATMTKAHGMLLLPVVAAVFVIEGIGLDREWRAICTDLLSLFVAWFACTAVISFFLGHGSINPIGSLYSDLGVHTAEHFGAYSLFGILELLLHHAATLVLVFGLPLFLCFWIALIALVRRSPDGNSSTLRYSAFAITVALVGMLLVTVVFTMSMVGTGVGQNLTRLYGRYYEHFALLGTCFGILGSRRVLTNWCWLTRLIILAVFLVVLVVAWRISFSVTGQYPIDFATAYGLYGSYIGRKYALVVAGTAAAVALLLPGRAPMVFGFALLAWLAFDTAAMERLRWSMIEPPAGRIAAGVASATAGVPNVTVEIVGSGYTVPVLTAAFHLLKDRVHFALGADADQCGFDGKEPDWVVVVDGMADPCGYQNVARIDDASAAQRVPVGTAAPSTALRLHATLAMIGSPELEKDGQRIKVVVNVSNDGFEAFGSANMPHSVNLGAHAIGPSGGIVYNDLARGHVPQIAPGGVAKVTIFLPLEKTLGHRVELLPVEEGVAWFSKWGTKPLIIGPFSACSHQAGANVCDGSGRALPTAE